MYECTIWLHDRMYHTFGVRLGQTSKHCSLELQTYYNNANKHITTMQIVNGVKLASVCLLLNNEKISNAAVVNIWEQTTTVWYKYMHWLP